MTYRILVPRPGIETWALSSESAESNHGTAKILPFFFFGKEWMDGVLSEPSQSGSVFLLLLHI